MSAPFLVADTRLYSLPLAMSVRPSVTFLNSKRFSQYCSCPTIRDWIAVYPALFYGGSTSIASKLDSRKSVRWSAVPVPCLSTLWSKLRGEQGSGPEGVDDLCFHTYGEFSPPSSYPPSPQPPGPYLSLEAHIPASRPKSQS